MQEMANKDEYKEWLAETLQKAMEEEKLSHRGLAAKIGVSDVALLSWVKGRSMPNPESQMKIAKYLGLTATPFWESQLGKHADARKLKEDRLRNLIARLPPEKQEEFLDLIEDLARSWVKRHGSSDELPTQKMQ